MTREPRQRHIHQLYELCKLTEPTFASSLPLLGNAVVRGRRLWNWMSTKWYVRPIIEQQSEMNRELVQVLEEIDLSVQALHLSSANNESAVLRLSLERAALEARVRRLEEQLAEFNKRLSLGKLSDKAGDYHE